MTALESVDTPMMDYLSDGDIAMHAGPSDLWTYEEVTMDDDRTTEHGSVEIEMEEYETADIEYEMADGEHTAHVDPAPEIEVYDASPAVAPVPDLPQELAPHTDTPQAPIAHPDRLAPTNVAVDGLEEPAPTPAGELPPPTAIDSGLAVVDHLPAPEYHGEHAVPAAVSFDNATRPSGSTEEPPFNAAQIDPSFRHIDKDISEPVLEASASQSAAHLISTEYPEVSPQEVAPPGEAERDTAEQADCGARVREETPASTSSDPHEVTDGVFIDPPPAVLLSFSTGDLPDCALFNHLPSGSGSSSPRATAGGSSVDMDVFFQHMPMLYYEPLSHLFEALRCDERIIHVSSLSNGELVLNACDIQLSITEDNVYARDITLHDLGVLHESSALPGPLRLRLEVSTTRFITRYYELKNRLGQLNLASDNTEYNTGDDAANPEPDADAGQYAYEDPAGEDPARLQDEAATELPSHATAIDQTQDQLDHSASQNDDPHDSLLPPEKGAADEVQEEDGVQGTFGDPADPALDADQVHGEADTENAAPVGEQTEYEDYNNNLEEDDERYGEDLPEDLGGDADADDNSAAVGEDEYAEEEDAADSALVNEGAGTEDIQQEAFDALEDADGALHSLEDEDTVALTLDEDDASTTTLSDHVDLADQPHDFDPESAVPLGHGAAELTGNDKPIGRVADVAETDAVDLDEEPQFLDEDDDWGDDTDIVGSAPPEELAAGAADHSTPSVSSKRSIEELDLGDEFTDFSPASPGSKRARTQ